MADNKILYLSLFTTITNAIESLNRAQKIVEDLYPNSIEHNTQSIQDWLEKTDK